MMKNYTLFFVIIALSLNQFIIAGEINGHSDPKVIPVITKQPEEKKIYPIAIIGAGAGGTMAVQRAVLNNNEVLLFTGTKQERRRSRGNWVRKVDNIPGLGKYQRTILELRNEVLQELVNGPLGNNLLVVEESISLIEKDVDFFKLKDGAGHTYYVKYVVMATGIMDEQPIIQGSIRSIFEYANGQTIGYCSLCDGHRSFGKQAVVIGYSKSAAHIALLLVEKYHLTSMTILTNGKCHEFTPELLQRIQEKNIRILQTPIREILGNKEEKQLTGFTLEDDTKVEAEMGFIALGIRPNNQLALQLGAQIDADGLVITDSSGESSVPNLFIAGDLRANSMKQIYTAWQHAVDSVQLINRRIRE